MNNELMLWVNRLCEFAGQNEEFRDEFVAKLKANADVLEEFEYYFYNGSFLGEESVEGMTLVDIMIWQMDHFKSDLDRGFYDMQSNPDKMLLMAFDTMLNMKTNPEKYISKFKTDTGTDYPGKY